MSSFQDFLILVSILVEAGLLCWLEKKAWNTLVTPLFILMLPYVAVLLISVAISGNFGFIDFYYPSILIWNAGLLLFAIPSFAFSFLCRRNNYQTVSSGIRNDDMPRIFTLIGLFLVMVFLYRILQTVRSSHFILGSDEFAEEFAGYGFWGHLKRFGSVMLSIYIYYLDRNRRWLWLFIIVLLSVMVINMVKGTMIIPCVVGVFMRIVSGKTKISGSLLLSVAISAVAVFFVTLVLTIVVVNENDLDDKALLFIFQHFVHYLTSGTLGLSMDMELGFPDRGDIDVIFTQFINIYNQISGDKTILSPVNPVYHFTGTNLTNVRTVFGTLYIYTNHLQFSVYILCLSSICYFFKIVSDASRNLYVNSIYFYLCSLLAMGWFEFYFFHLDLVEIPVILLLLYCFDWAFVGRKYKYPIICST